MVTNRFSLNFFTPRATPHVPEVIIPDYLEFNGGTRNASSRGYVHAICSNILDTIQVKDIGL